MLLREVLGDDHPDTLVGAANLAVTLHQAGRSDEAEQLRTRVLGRFSHVLGANHPNALLLRDWQRIDLDLEALRI